MNFAASYVGLPIPTLIVSATAVLILAAGIWGRSPTSARGARGELLLTLLATGATLACAFGAVLAMMSGSVAPPSHLFVFDSLAAVSTVLVSLSAAALFLLSSTYLSSYRLPQAEYHALILFSLAGSFLCFGAEHFLVLVLGLELATLPLVFLAGYDFERRTSNEAAQKIFFASAVSSAVLIFGVAFLYGSTGHLDFAGVQANLDPGRLTAVAGVALVFVGFAMKLGLVPFHQWLPDVQQGAPTSVSVYLAVCGISTLVLAWMRLMLHGLPGMEALLSPVFLALSVATLFFANLMALFQRNLKRMLGWLAVAQLGTFMLAFAASTPESYSALIFYLGVQAGGFIGAFGVVMTTAEGARERDRLEHFAGIARHRKTLAVAMTVFMLSLAGIPGTAGFWARWQLLSASVAAGDLGFVIVQNLASVLTLYVCMRVPVVMFMREEEFEIKEAVLPSTVELGVLLACIAVAIGFGVWPDPELPPAFGGSLMDVLRSSVGS